MNTKILAVLVLVYVSMLVDTEALRFRFRGRKIWREVRKPLCNAGCSYGCTYVTGGSGAPVCGVACNKVCGRRRRAIEEVNGETTTVRIPFSSDFDEYDTNKDGFISLQELANYLNLDTSDKGVKQAFFLADSDDDSMISNAEFVEAPWDFENNDEDAFPQDVEE